MTHRDTWIRGIAVALVLPLAAAGCGGSDGTADDAGGGTTTAVEGGGDGAAPEPRDGGIVTFAVEADADGYHPIDNRWSMSGNYVGSSMFEPLMVEVGDGTLEPWLAESMTPNADATEWTIVLKEGITFHDGTPLDADAVALNIESRLTNPLTATANEPVEGAEAVDPTTVVVTMKRPWSAYDHSLAAVGGYMVAPAMLGDDAATDPIGTGPFQFVEWVPDSHLTVERYDGYWEEPAHLDGVRFEFIPDVSTRRAAIESDSVDAIITPQPSAIADFREDDSLQLFEHSSEPFHVLLNSAVPPFDDPIARQALALATDQEAVIASLGGEDVLEPAGGPFVPTNPWHLADSGYPDTDRDRARGLAARYEAEHGAPITVTIKGSAGQEAELAGSLIEQWGAIGVDATFEPVDQASLIGEIVFGDYEAGLWRSHNWVDPDFNYIFWHSSTDHGVGEVSINFTHVNNPDLDAALDSGRTTLDPVERRAAYDDVQRILNQELTHLWLYGVVWGLVSVDTVHGWDDLVDRGLSRLEPKVFWSDVWVEK